MKVAPSMLACDFANIGSEIKKITSANADLIHLDVMDGHFVPNISFGADIITAMRKYTNLPFDVHLMISNPFKYIKNFVKSGADIITFHIEAEKNVTKTIKKIKNYGVKPGLAIKPNTPAEAVFPYLKHIYMVLVMTVEPGFGGQSFMIDMMKKVDQIKSKSKIENPDLLIEVDGGINLETIKYAEKAGVDISVAGTSVFKSSNIYQTIKEFKKPDASDV